MSNLGTSKLFNVSGLVAVITGGGTGLGLIMARALAENGAAKIYIIGRRGDKLDQAASLYPNVIVPLPGDITNQDEIKRMAERVKSDVGYINLLITNAGKSGPMLESLKPRHTIQDFVQLAWSSPMEDFTSVFELNCTSIYYSVIAFLELLDAGNKVDNPYKGGKSQVIATASTASFLRNPRAGYAYLASKAGVISLMKSLSTFCVPWGIRFNTIAAGLFPSDSSEILFKPYIINKTKKLTEEGVFSRAYQPAERAGSEEDMGGLILYMCSRAGGFLNGSVMLTDGGKLATMPATY